MVTLLIGYHGAMKYEDLANLKTGLSGVWFAVARDGTSFMLPSARDWPIDSQQEILRRSLRRARAPKAGEYVLRYNMPVAEALECTKEYVIGWVATPEGRTPVTRKGWAELGVQCFDERELVAHPCEDGTLNAGPDGRFKDGFEVGAFLLRQYADAA